jgi:hypothetical protein
MTNAAGLLVVKKNVDLSRSGMSAVHSDEERRKASRYPLHQDLRFRVLHREIKLSGTGQTLDFSSSGILFWSKEFLRVGNIVEVSVDWPVRLDGTCPIKIVAEGPVVRVDGHRIAMRITRYEFRTRSSRLMQSGFDLH